VRSTALPLLILVAISLIPTEVGAESITYFMENYPAIQNGYTVTGTITTDGTTGTFLPATDITDWHITIQLGTATVETFDPTDSYVIPRGRFDATPIAMSVSVNNRLDISSDPEFVERLPYMAWLDTNLGYLIYQANIPNNLLWFGDLPTGSPIATVPEPSSAVLASIVAVAAFLAYGWSRHRRAQRRQAAA
jgi:hypothetical protein